MVIDRTAALMIEKYRHDDAEAILVALSEISDMDQKYMAKAIPLGAEALGNAILNISFGYWSRCAKEEAEREISEQWDSCRCHGVGCGHCRSDDE